MSWFRTFCIVSPQALYPLDSLPIAITCALVYCKKENSKATVHAKVLHSLYYQHKDHRIMRYNLTKELKKEKEEKFDGSKWEARTCTYEVLSQSLMVTSTSMKQLCGLIANKHSQVNPFTPESDQCQISPAASQEIWHHTVWRTWLFIAYSDERWF